MPVYPGVHNGEHRHSGIGLMTPAAVQYGQAAQLHAARARVLEAAHATRPERFVHGLPKPAHAAASSVDQQARDEGCLTGLDRLRRTVSPDLTGSGRSGSRG